MAPETAVLIELMGRDGEVYGFTNDTLESVTASNQVSKNYELRDNAGSVNSRTLLTFEWKDTTTTTTSKKQNKKSKKAKTTTTTPTASPMSMTVPDAEPSVLHRLRLANMYDSGKHVYEYATSFRIVAPFAHMSESSFNFVIKKIGWESPEELDQSIVPLLSRVDGTVEEKLSLLAEYLAQKQESILKVKDSGIDTFTKTTDKIVTKASDVVSTSTANVKKVAGATVDKVSTVSSAAYSSLSGAAFYCISFVPIVGPKLTQ